MIWQTRARMRPSRRAILALVNSSGRRERGPEFESGYEECLVRGANPLVAEVRAPSR